MNPEAMTKLIKKNAVIRVEGDRRLRRLSRDRSCASELQAREVAAVRQELVELKASQIVGNRYRLSAQEQKGAVAKQNVLATIDLSLRNLISKMHSSGRSSAALADAAAAAANASEAGADPFHLRAIVDVDCGLEAESRKGSFDESTSPHTSAACGRRLLRGSALYKHILAQIGEERPKWILPGPCSSFHSIKEYFEEEKNGIVRQWSLSERRQARVRWIMQHAPPSCFIVDRTKPLSQVYADFALHRMHSSERQGRHPTERQGQHSTERQGQHSTERQGQHSTGRQGQYPLKSKWLDSNEKQPPDSAEIKAPPHPTGRQKCNEIKAVSAR